jgi:hypothetical protein
LAAYPEHVEQTYFRLFQGHALQTQMHSMAVDGAGASLLATVFERQVPATVIKGPAVARFYPEGWPRPYADLDVVVQREDFDTVVALAEDQGFYHSERAVPQWEWFDRVCREGTNLHSDRGGNVDVHHHLAPWVLGTRLTPSDMAARSEPAWLCGVPVSFAAPPDLLVASALHVVNDLWKGKVGLVSWRDIVLLIRVIGQVESRAAFERVRLGWLFDELIQELTETAPQLGFTAGATPVQLPATTRHHLSLLGWWNDSVSARHRLAWAIRLPPTNAIAFLAGTAVPSPRYIHARHGTYRAYWRRSVRETVSTAHGSDFRMTTVDDHEAPS